MTIQCIEFGYSLTEPICASCVVNEVKIWLCEQGIRELVSERINYNLKHLLKKIEFLDYALFPSKGTWDESTLKCIKCDQNMHVMCFYCINKQVSRIISENIKNKKVIENFGQCFNLDPYDYKLVRN